MATAAPAPAPRADSELAILDEEAARAALRRGLAAPSGAEMAGSVEPAEAALPADAVAERRALSDEFLIDHLVADVYRTTIFPRQLDAVGESRSAARSLLSALTSEERRSLLREALQREDGQAVPSFRAARIETESPAPGTD